jgi:hypothetical protein
VAEDPTTRHPVVRIEVRIQVGPNLMSGTDDPLFLGLRGPAGREFRLKLAGGGSLRRGQEAQFVLGAPNDPAANVEQSELNDPTSPALDADGIDGVYLRKGLEPIPNVRGFGEMDDRVEVETVAVQIDVANETSPRRFERQGPIWLGLACGLFFEIPRTDEAT